MANMDVERLPGYVLPSMPPKWTGPISASFDTPCGAAHYVYLFGLDGTDVMLTRVADVDIEDSSKYRFWDGAGWVPDAEKVRTHHANYWRSPRFSVWLITSSLIGGSQSTPAAMRSQVCMNHTIHAGADPNRMSEGWTEGEVDLLMPCWSHLALQACLSSTPSWPTVATSTLRPPNMANRLAPRASHTTFNSVGFDWIGNS